MKSNLMEYKGYKASICYDKEDEIFVGEVFGVNDLLSFHGKSIDELKSSFHNCIDNYLDLCQSINKEPDKYFSGCFNVRTNPSLHKRLSEYAVINNCSLNQVITMALENFLIPVDGNSSSN